MVDIHSHVLYGLDDGARTVEDSIAMLNMAADSGTTGIVASPHANTEYQWNLAVNEARIAEVQKAVGNRIRVYSGCDFHLTFDNVNDAIDNPTKYTINHKQWLLVEFSDYVIFQNSGEILGRLRGAGMLPIITHPERNQILQQRFDTLAQWVEDGSYIQVTAQSLTGLFGSAARKFAEKLIERGLVHFVASDAHDTEYRTPKLDAAFDLLKNHYGEEYARLMLMDNPTSAVEGILALPVVIPKRKKWLGVWG